jgi:transcription-repair coupling factor (superfamily II helicase)
LAVQAPLLTYFGEPKQTNAIQLALEKEQTKIQLTGIVGSSFAITASAVVRESNKPHLFIFRDKEAASYFVNDIENLLKNEVFFFPASYRRAYQIEETDNANILLRAEVLNKLNNKRNPIIITYSEALSEKVVSRKELKKHTIALKIKDDIAIDFLEEMLEHLNFEKVDFVIKAGQYSIRGGILDVYSFADENPFRIEFFDTEIESIRTFDINTQLSVSTESKITIIPNTEAKKSIESQVSFLEYLPKNSVIWTKDIKYSKGVLDDYFDRANEQYNRK